ncbi:MAG: hypothetical protein LVO36_01930, partial [Nitrosopumilus sp. (ex Thoosa mismalolli)]|nr:hypothetical protein [Nitrosopumilus sp. (ex Thoosa mismalolli)]
MQTAYTSGVVSTTIRLQKSHNISYCRVYRIMKENGMVVVPSKTKSRRRKWVRFERKHSNAIWHVDWHAMKETRFHGLKLVTYLDDVSRYIVASRSYSRRPRRERRIDPQKDNQGIWR